MDNLIETPIWHTLHEHQRRIAPLHMRELFAKDSARFQKFSLSVADILLDYSKNRITEETLDLLEKLALARDLPNKISALFAGAPINSTENRAALHTALRYSEQQPLIINDSNIHDEIRLQKEKIKIFTHAIHAQQWRGYSNKPITDIVNIGIGGSELGPALAIAALQSYAIKKIRCHFISNLDGKHITDILQTLNPEQTLFIISSKYFSTQETLMNAQLAKNWLLHNAPLTALKNHFVAITAKPERASEFGITAENIFLVHDWVGGRFSLWSSVGLPIALMLGYENFQQLLAGAAAMDQHFYQAPLRQNMPVILALLSVWYINFFHAQSHAILPYQQDLFLLPAYLQQAHMESLGKQVRHNGKAVDYATGSVIWGGVGTNGQHAFHQLLHQGTPLIPADFIIAAAAQHDLDEHQDALFANCLSQSQALMLGKNLHEATAELIATGMSEAQAKQLAPHKVIPGNRPSNTLVLSRLSPFTLGALIALYEHKIFTQSVIWDINCFDQWGVELGKQFAQHILQDLEDDEASSKHDESTRGLIAAYKKRLRVAFE